MFKYLIDKIQLFWLNWKANRMLRNLPKSGICPHCNKPVENATSWTGGQPCHYRCWAEDVWGDEVECHQETIECPNCGSIESATVEHSQPFNTYIHHCSKCEYIIMESEWEPVSSLEVGSEY